MFPLSPTYLNLTRDTETMDKQETTSNTTTLRLTIELDLDSRTVPSFGTVRRDGMKGARDIELSLQELGIDTDKVNVFISRIVED